MEESQWKIFSDIYFLKSRLLPWQRNNPSCNLLYYFFQCPGCSVTGARDLAACHKSSLWCSFLRCRDVFSEGRKTQPPWPAVAQRSSPYRAGTAGVAALSLGPQGWNSPIAALWPERGRVAQGYPFLHYTTSSCLEFCLMIFYLCVFPTPNFSSLPRICTITHVFFNDLL